MTNVNFKQFEDEFGNVIQEFEVIKYEKYANGEWVEVERRESGRTYYNVDGKLLYRLDDTSFELNMDFNSPNCGACYVVGKALENKKKITGNYELITVLSGNESLTLKKQTYSNQTSFYSLQDKYGNFKVQYASSDIKNILNQLLHENNVYSERKEFCNEDLVEKVIASNNQIIDVINKEILNVAS